MSRVRDMTQAQFLAALKRHGWSEAGFMGYVNMPLPGGGSMNVSKLNAGSRRRDQLAYLLKARERHDQRERDSLALSDALAAEFGLP